LQNTRKNILYISYDGMTDQLGQSQVIPYLKALTKKGSYNFVLVSCEKKKYFIQNRKIVEDLLKDFPITWQPQIYHKFPPVLSSVFDLWNIYRNAKKLHAKYDFKLVHCRSYISSLVGLAFKKKYNIPFIFDMRGFWADERVDGNLWDIKKPVYKFVYTFFKKKELEFLNNSYKTISLTKAGKKEILKWGNLKIKEEDIAVIPCCVDLEHFSEKNVNQTFVDAFKKKENISSENFILTYLGTIGTWYMLPEMLRFFFLLQEQNKSAKFLFISPEESHEYIRSEANKNGIQNNQLILFHAKRKEVPSLISLSNYSIYFIKPAYSKTSSSPTKQAELMAMGVPSITNKYIGDTEAILTSTNAGIIVEDFTDQSYQEVILKIVNKTYTFNSSEIKKGALDYYSLELGAEKYFKIYSSII
jgi:glycosyltransferase involved in cell wall biosynthesis